MDNKIPVRSYTKEEIRDIYGISRSTFRKWITPLEEKFRNYTKDSKIFTAEQVRVIFEHLGHPEHE